jgi:hypothetical protein
LPARGQSHTPSTGAANLPRERPTESSGPRSAISHRTCMVWGCDPGPYGGDSARLRSRTGIPDENHGLAENLDRATRWRPLHAVRPGAGAPGASLREPRAGQRPNGAWLGWPSKYSGAPMVTTSWAEPPSRRSAVGRSSALSSPNTAPQFLPASDPYQRPANPLNRSGYEVFCLTPHGGKCTLTERSTRA